MALSSSNDRNKRRRRRRSTQARAQSNPARISTRPIQTRYMEILASTGIVVAAIALIALIWITVARSGENYRSVLHEVRREMLNVAQSLNVLEAGLPGGSRPFRYTGLAGSDAGAHRHRG